MNGIWRLTLAIGIILATLAGAMHPAHAEREMLGGHWRLLFHATCVLTPRTIDACRTLQAPATFAVIGVVGASLTVNGIGDYQADSRGRYTVHFTTMVIEHVPQGSAPAHCSNALVFDGAYSGACREEGWGHGHIAQGRTGMPDFYPVKGGHTWQDDATGWWDGTPPARFAESSPVDTFNPACPGVYNTARFMKLFGYQTVPSGITARLVLTHH